MMEFRQPFKGDYPITLDFGEEWLPTYKAGEHKGIDYGCPLGTPILASEAGTVMVTGYQLAGYGNYVILAHMNGYTSIYAHLSAVNVKQGMTVKRGDVIGKSGSTGNSSGPHLHFEIHDNRNLVIDPKTVLHSVLDDTPITNTPNTVKPKFDTIQGGFCVVVCDYANVRCHCDMSRVLGMRKKGDVISVGDEVTIWGGLPYRDYYDPEYNCWLRIAEHDPYTQIIRNTEI